MVGLYGGSLKLSLPLVPMRSVTLRGSYVGELRELKELVQKWDGNGGNLILITHYVIITAVTDAVPSSGEIIVTDKNFNVLSKITTF